VREARHLARHGAEAETGVGRIIGGLEAPVVETEALGRAILQVKLAVVGLRERFARERLRQIGGRARRRDRGSGGDRSGLS
jgi:hypothetical protein